MEDSNPQHFAPPPDDGGSRPQGATEKTVGYGVTIVTVIVGLLPSIIPMTPDVILGLRILCVVLAIFALIIFADVAGYRRAALRVLAVCLVAFLSFALGEHEGKQASLPTSSATPSQNSLFPEFQTHVLAHWGDSAGASCSAIIDGAKILQEQDTSRVVLICGFSDPATDITEDTRITVTHPYSILDDRMALSAAFSKPMLELFTTMIEQGKLKPQLPKGTFIAVPYTQWYAVAVLPAGTDSGLIRSLSDIRRNGGKIIDGHSATAASLVQSIVNR